MSTSLASPAKVRVPAASIGRSLVLIIVVFPILLLLSSALLLIPDVGATAFVVAVGLLGVLFYFLPTGIALDVSDRLPEVKELKANDKSLKDVDIRHQYFYAIVAVNILFGWTVIGYVVAFIMAHMPCDADVPPKLAVAFGPSQSSIEAKLKEVDSLLSKGLLTEAEAKARRDAIVKTV